MNEEIKLSALELLIEEKKSDLEQIRKEEHDKKIACAKAYWELQIANGTASKDRRTKAESDYDDRLSDYEEFKNNSLKRVSSLREDICFLSDQFVKNKCKEDK